MSFTYVQADLQADSAAGRLARLRRAISDTTNSPSPARFTDEELASFLAAADDDENTATAAAIDAIVLQLALLPTSESGSNYSVTRQIASLTALAASYRAQGTSGGLQLATIDTSSPNDLLDSYRESWWDVETLPGVE